MNMCKKMIIYIPINPFGLKSHITIVINISRNGLGGGHIEQKYHTVSGLLELLLAIQGQLHWVNGFWEKRYMYMLLLISYAVSRYQAMSLHVRSIKCSKNKL